MLFLLLVLANSLLVFFLLQSFTNTGLPNNTDTVVIRKHRHGSSLGKDCHLSANQHVRLAGSARLQYYAAAMSPGLKENRRQMSICRQSSGSSNNTIVAFFTGEVMNRSKCTTIRICGTVGHSTTERYQQVVPPRFKTRNESFRQFLRQFLGCLPADGYRTDECPTLNVRQRKIPVGAQSR